MPTAIALRSIPLLHPLHAILLSFPVALFSGALISDITYLNSAEVQWSNFSAWFITGGLVFGGPVLLWAAMLAIFSRRQSDGRRRRAYLVLIAFMWLIGLINAFQHSKDGWSSVGTIGLILSILTALLALIAAWIGHSGHRVAEEKV